MQIQKLSYLRPGETGEISHIENECSLRRRLQDIGFISGIKITCELTSPLGDPKAYRINGALIALRNEDTEKINIII